MFGLTTTKKYRALLAENTRLTNENHYLAASGARLARERAQLLAEVNTQGRSLWLLRGDIKRCLDKLKGQLPARAGG